MDVSDGLLGDLKKLLCASGVDGVIRLEDLPLSPAARHVLIHDPSVLRDLLTGGDDYEILGTVGPEKWEGFKTACQTVDLQITSLGTVTQSGKGRLRIENGRESPFLWNPRWNEGSLSYEHD
jgi:thiamine-monophosphate kinase